MKSLTSLLLALPLMAAAPPLPTAPTSPQAKSPAEIVGEAPAEDWVDILPSDLLVMDLAADGQGRARRVVIQLAPAPFANGWVSNVRKLAQARWWDGLAIVRVQDNYVVQWGDPEAETAAKARPLPQDLARMAERDYVARGRLSLATGMNAVFVPRNTQQQWSGFYRGWPVGRDGRRWHSQLACPLLWHDWRWPKPVPRYRFRRRALCRDRPRAATFGSQYRVGWPCRAGHGASLVSAQRDGKLRLLPDGW